MARVSILIPTYNRANYLPTAIQSALDQTYRDLEVIVVDDGSTDTTADVVRSISDKRLCYFYQENSGVSGALNTAWRASTGEYVAMLGSDDEMLPQQIETLLPILEQNTHLGLVYARAQAMDAVGKIVPQILGGSLKFPDKPLSSILYANTICSIAALIRRRAIDEVGGLNPALTANEDWDLWIRLAEHWGIQYEDKILARYRMHEQSLTANKSEQYDNIITSRIRIIKAFYARKSIPDEASGVLPAAMRNVYLDAAIRSLTIGKRSKAFSYYAKGLATQNNPISTTLRFASVAIFDLYLSKTRWGVRLVDALVAWRHSAD